MKRGFKSWLNAVEYIGLNASEPSFVDYFSEPYCFRPRNPIRQWFKGSITRWTRTDRRPQNLPSTAQQLWKMVFVNWPLTPLWQWDARHFVCIDGNARMHVHDHWRMRPQAMPSIDGALAIQIEGSVLAVFLGGNVGVWGRERPGPMLHLLTNNGTLWSLPKKSHSDQSRRWAQSQMQAGASIS
jgi:hypothetical protein